MNKEETAIENEVEKKKSKVDDIDKIVSARLRTRRIMLGISQQELSKVIGVSTQQIQKYERGTNRIASGKLHSLSKRLNVPITYFFDNINENNIDMGRGNYFYAANGDFENSNYSLSDNHENYEDGENFGDPVNYEGASVISKLDNEKLWSMEKEVIKIVNALCRINKEPMRKAAINIVEFLAEFAEEKSSEKE